VLGHRWRTEDEAIKAVFKKRAEDLKRKHIEQHPEYQYQPRKPSERKKRATKAKAARRSSSSPSASSHSTDMANAAAFPAPAVLTTPPAFTPILDGSLLLFDFSEHLPSTLDDMIAHHNSNPSLYNGPQLNTTPQVMMSGPSAASAAAYSGDYARLDFTSLNTQAHATRGALTSELAGMDNNTSDTNNVFATFTNFDTTSEATYDASWKTIASAEQDRMTALESELSSGLTNFNNYYITATDVPTTSEDNDLFNFFGGEFLGNDTVPAGTCSPEIATDATFDFDAAGAFGAETIFNSDGAAEGDYYGA
jgi:hypothetical protein